MCCASWYVRCLVYLEAMCLPRARSKKMVYQVSLECEERGNMLLHLWRQTLRIFNQVFTLLRSEQDSLFALALLISSFLIGSANFVLSYPEIEPTMQICISNVETLYST